MYKILFCVKRQLPFLSGAFVLEDVAGIHRGVLCFAGAHPPALSCHHPSSNNGEHWVWGSAMLPPQNGVALALRSPSQHWCDEVRTAGVWFFPLWRRGLGWPGWNKPQRTFHTTKNSSAILSCDTVANGSVTFYNYKCSFGKLKLKNKKLKKCFRNRGLLKWI